MHGENSVTIHRPAEVVFDHIADGTRNATWRPGVIEVSRLNGDGGEGTVWRQLAQGPAGKSADADYRVTRCTRPNLYGFDVIAGPMRGTFLYTVSEQPDGEAVVALAVTLKPRGALRILTGFILRQVVEELDSLDTLRSILESRAP